MEKRIILILSSIFLIFVIGIIYFNNSDNIVLTGNPFADYSFETIVIPVKAHLIKEERGVYTSSRYEENIIELFNEVNRIWSQGEIYFSIEEIVITNVSVNAIPNAINGNYQELYSHENFDKQKINVFFVQSLNGINGLALMDIDSILISDFTSVNDYRATAHELGHLLGLKHVEPENRLLARGKNGELLTLNEILLARENALKLHY